MTAWLLIFYMSGYSAGGPGVAPFATKEACEKAVEVIKASGLRSRFEAHVCVPQS